MLGARYPPAQVSRCNNAAAGDDNMQDTHLGDDVIPGAPHMGCMWFLPRPRNNSEKPGVDAHTHDFDEILGFYGCDPYNPSELHGEVEFWLGDEQYLLTKSCTIYVPKGLKHCPLFIRRLDKPLFHFGWTPTLPK